jgi:hypothetical protein
VGVQLKKLHRAEGGVKMFGVFRVKNHTAKIPAPKKSAAKKAVKSPKKKTLIGSTKTNEEVKMSSFIYQNKIKGE